MTTPQASTAKKPETAKPFWWFQGESVEQLTEQLIQAGPATARLEMHVDENDSMTLHVIPADDAAAASAKFQPTNDSHRCPPQCPT